jgi:hypothetical protein
MFMKKKLFFTCILTVGLMVLTFGQTNAQTADQQSTTNDPTIMPTDPVLVPNQDIQTYSLVFGGPCADGVVTDISSPCPCSGICNFDTIGSKTLTSFALETGTEESKLFAKAAIPVQFHLLKNDHSILVMSFKTTDLKKKQPNQLQYFQNGKYYKFGATFSLDRYAFKKLGVPAHARITPKDKCMIMPEKKGITTVHIKYSIAPKQLISGTKVKM